MKHIFKKLRNHDTNRTNGTTPPSPSSSLPPTTVSDDRANSVQSPATSSSSSYSPNLDNTTTTNHNNNAADVYGSHQSDYFISEEEFQVQLALAISASNSEEFRDDRDKDQIRAATLLSLKPDEITSRRDAAELLSQRYWDYNVLDYDEKVVDGFYDLYGLSMDPASQGKMPSLADLQATCGDPKFEVVIVNRAIDPVLEELHQVAHCFALDCPTTDKSLLVPRLAELVTEHLGGPVMDANVILEKWMEKTTDLRTSLHTSILPIGSLNIGLSRHRSLLFKVLADDVGIPCRLVKGSHYTGNDDDAVNIIKLKNEREFLVDLMAAPGTLIPAEILNIKDTSINSYNPKIGESSRILEDNSLGVDILRLDVVHKLGNGESLVENNIPFNRNSSPEGKESVTPTSSASSGELPISIGNSSNGNSMRVALGPGNQSHLSSSSVVGSYSQHKEKQGSLILDVVKENLNVAPYSSDTTKESENLFADLNPFQMAGSRKISAQNRYTNNKANDFHKKRENLASVPGRPPLPLPWKNRSTSNEIPRTKQYEFVEGLLPRKNQEVKHYNTSSLASTSYNSSDKVYPEVHNVNVDGSRVSYPGSTNIGNGHHSGGGDAVLTSSTDQYTRLEENDNQTAKQHIVIQSPHKTLQGEYYTGGEVLRKDTVNNSTELEKTPLDKHAHRNNKYERYMGTKVMSKHLDSSGSQVDTGSSRLDPMLEDVAEWEIPWEDLVVGERIGLGSYGEVFHADWEGKEVAVKKFLDQDFSGDALDEFRSEVRIMRRLRHPNVVLFLGAVTRPPNLSIITEFLPRGSLYRILRRPSGHIDERHRIKMALDVAKGMNCLHTSIPTVVHRDLKSPNLLVDNNWNVKVSDFGLSRLKHSTFLSSKSTAGTPEWMAPEVLRNEQSDEKCDVYSFGVILWELATLKMPWTGLNPMQVVGAVGFQNRRLEIPKEVDPLVAKMILECWQTDPSLRPSFAQLTTTLEPLQRLVIPSHQEHQS